MAATSDERREVAERLRKAADSDEWLDVTINNAIFSVFGEVRRPIADTLADLIDPTCHVVEGSEPLYMDDETEFRLSCGHVADMVTDCPPAFCPECEARLVTNDD